MGIASFSQTRHTENGSKVQYFIKQGAIPFIKTNIPMYLKTIESINHIYGRVKNPWNIDRTPGGSSGGESCVVASYCSPAGLGADIGGSIRTPCAYTYLWGLKPSSKRITYLGEAIPTPTGRLGQECIFPVPGPICRSPECVLRMFKSLNDPEQSLEDTFIDFQPWNEEEFQSKKPLRIGYIKSIDSVFKTCVSQRRAVEEAIAYAESCGHTLVEIKFEFQDFYKAFLEVLAHGDKPKEITEVLQGEKPIDEYKLFFLRGKLPLTLLKIIGKFINKDPTRFNILMNHTARPEVRDLAEAYIYVEECKQAFHKYYTNLKLDAVIFPSHGLPALKHTTATDLLVSAVYPMVFNVLDWAAGSIPISFIKPGEVGLATGKNKLKNFSDYAEVYPGVKYKSGYDDKINKLSQECLDSTAIGLPTGVQVASYGLGSEERIIRLMYEIDQAKKNVRGDESGIYPWDIKV